MFFNGQNLAIQSPIFRHKQTSTTFCYYILSNLNVGSFWRIKRLVIERIKWLVVWVDVLQLCACTFSCSTLLAVRRAPLGLPCSFFSSSWSTGVSRSIGWVGWADWIDWEGWMFWIDWTDWLTGLSGSIKRIGWTDLTYWIDWMECVDWLDCWMDGLGGWLEQLSGAGGLLE